jgi:hypothetical protein
MAMNEDFDRMYRRAVRSAREFDRKHPPAVAASYDPRDRTIRVDFANGCAFLFPADLGQGLRGATDAQLARVELMPSGHGLHWEDLDADLWIPSLMAGVFGSRAWMAELGRRGGSVRTPAKARAARRNGLKGGRPKKSARKPVR